MRSSASKFRALLLSLFVITAVLSFTACTYRGYRGEHAELCSVAWVNVPTAKGCIPNGEIINDAEVTPLDTDSYGRVLFSYSEDLSGESAYLLVMQYTEGEFVYYYPDLCYVFASIPEGCDVPDVDSPEALSLLDKNDWEKPIAKDKCEGTKTVRKKPEGKIKVNDSYFDNIVKEHHSSNGVFIHPKNSSSLVDGYYFLCADSYGRELYVVNTHLEEYTNKECIRYKYSFLVVVHPDKRYDASTVVLLDDPRAAQSDQSLIKEQNGWNTPR